MWVRGQRSQLDFLSSPASCFRLLCHLNSAFERNADGVLARIRWEKRRSWSLSSAFRDETEPLAKRGSFEFKRKR